MTGRVSSSACSTCYRLELSLHHSSRSRDWYFSCIVARPEPLQVSATHLPRQIEETARNASTGSTNTLSSLLLSFRMVLWCILYQHLASRIPLNGPHTHKKNNANFADRKSETVPADTRHHRQKGVEGSSSEEHRDTRTYDICTAQCGAGRCLLC